MQCILLNDLLRFFCNLQSEEIEFCENVFEMTNCSSGSFGSAVLINSSSSSL